MDQLLREFLGEAEELVEVLSGDLQALRARRGDGRARRELVARIFRHVHTLKGSSASVELEGVTDIAHEFETLLDGVRLGRVEVDEAVLDTFENTVSALSQMLGAAANEEQPVAPPALIQRLRRLAYRAVGGGDSSNALAQVLAALPAEIARALSEYEEHRLREALREGARAFIVEVNFDLTTFDERFRDLSDALSIGGEIISTLPGMESAAPDQINFRIVYATDLQAEDLTARLEAFGEIKLTELAAAVADDESHAVEDEGAGSDAESFEPASIKPLTTLVRVELSELDAIIQAAQELQRETMSALDLVQPVEDKELGAELDERRARLLQRFAELEENLTGMRLVPVAQTLSRAVRAGTMAARSLSKEIDFEIEGGEVRLDKSVSDALADPLLHLLRNAVAHGIETADERAAAGKSLRGRIKLEAAAEGNRVRLRLTDDGRGISAQLVAEAARARGLVDAQALVSEEQALRLIFAPGLSTAVMVSNVSGRGVGLDVVERAVADIGGEIHVKSKVGAGTTFELLLPASLAARD
ncbi:MAG: Hpt domain-containing protein [Acidobacteria bacterium]|nr:Hpt domain-containing protein [Acidobacteriota bacterium]